jgi:hypothetical protein
MTDTDHTQGQHALRGNLEEQHLRIKAVLGNRSPQDLLNAIKEAEAGKADA